MARRSPFNWPRIRAGIFKGESGGDYNALFRYANRRGGPFAGHDVTRMTVDEAIRFANPRGPYAQWVKSQVGHVATPMGGFQIVGSTLQKAKRWAGLRGDERMSEDIQDRLGQAVLANQGTGAWKGYTGPADPAAANVRYDPRLDTPSYAHPIGSKLPGPPPEALGLPPTPEQQSGEQPGDLGIGPPLEGEDKDKSLGGLMADMLKPQEMAPPPGWQPQQAAGGPSLAEIIQQYIQARLVSGGLPSGQGQGGQGFGR